MISQLKRLGEPGLARRLSQVKARSLSEERLATLGKEFFKEAEKLTQQTSYDEFSNVYYVLNKIIFQDIGHENYDQAYELDRYLFHIMQDEKRAIDGRLSFAFSKMITPTKRNLKRYATHRKLKARHEIALDQGNNRLATTLENKMKKNSGVF